MSVFTADVVYCADEGYKAEKRGQWLQAAKWYWMSMWSYGAAEDPYHVMCYYEESCRDYDRCLGHLNGWQRLRLRIWEKWKEFVLRNR